MRFILSVILIVLVGVMPLSAQDDQQVLDEVLQEFGDENGPALIIQVTTPDGIWSAATGLADGSRVATPEDRFRIGSMSKTFVATVALMLAEDGLFELDDPASDWLPDDILDSIVNTDEVTIRQLLAMRSGIPDYLETDEFWSALEDDPAHIWTAAEALTYAYDLPALFAPDEEFYYSNTNYLLLQVIFEGASGKGLHTLIRERILDPLNLSDTYTQISETLPGEFVDGYEDFDEDGVAENVTDLNDGAGLADGGLISNVADLTTFYKALLQDQTLLSAESMAELLDFTDDGEEGGYSLGLSSSETDFGAAWGHSGGVVGFVSTGVYLPEEDVIIIALSASVDTDLDALADAVLDAME